MSFAYLFDSPPDRDDVLALRRAVARPDDPPKPPGGDQGLVARVRIGDEAAFDEMFTRYAAPLAAYAYGFVRSRAIAEELVQDVFLRVWDERTAWEVRGTVQAYLYAMIRGRALDHLKHERVQARWRLRASVGENAPASPPSPDRLVEQDETAARVRAVVAELPERVRETLALRWHGGLSYAEIAAVMHVSTRTVENQLAKGLRYLRDRLGDA